jgi:hypothetical protein
MAYPDLKGNGDNSMPGNQWPRPGVGAARWEARVIWRNLDWLNPNLQKAQRNARRKDVWNRRSSLRRGVKGLAASLRGESDAQ